MVRVAPTLELTVPAEPARVRPVRHAIADFARANGHANTSDLVLAVSEVVSNAVVHAYRDRDPGEIRISAGIEGHALVVVVADDGIGMLPRPDSPGFGVGLPLVAELAAGVQISAPPEGGSRVKLRFEA